MLIHILMATYQGAKYLPEQLASIEAQTTKDWKLHVRDDSSTDDTWQILKEFAGKHPNQVEIFQNNNRLGAKGNFALLLQEVQEPGDYVFCDQDDIWEPEKLVSLQKKLRERERVNKLPVLVYSDAVVIDEVGNVVAESFVGQTGVFLPEKRVMETLLLCNFVQGASAMWNQELHQIAGKHSVPEEALMHDWWLALVAAGQGEIVYLPERLTRYRQHGANVVGGFDRRKWHSRVRKKLFHGRIRQLVESNHQMQELRGRQAEAYQRIYGDRRVERYLEIMEKRPKCRRAYLGMKEGYIFLSKWYSVKYYSV